MVYAYKTKITITGSSDGIQTNYQLRFVIYKGVGDNSSSTIYLNNHSLNWPYDIKFYKSNESEALDFWRESYDTASEVCWVEVDSIPANPSTVDIYLYYGDSGASDLSNGSETFVFFDDFPNSSLDGTKWNYTGSPTVSSSICTLTRTSAAMYISGKSGYGQGYSLREKIKYGSVSGAWSGWETNVGTLGNIYLDEYDITNLYPGNDVTYGTYTHYVTLTAGYNILEISRYSGHTRFYINGTLMRDESTIVSTSTRYPVIHAYAASTIMYSDWVLIRKYTLNEPTNSIGGEQEGIIYGYTEYLKF
jgi:hypothetical protein